MCTIHGHQAVVHVDLAYGKLAPVPGFASLCWVFVPLREADPSGLATQKETPRLAALEGALVPALTQALGAAYVARATTHGRREFYFYARSADGLQEAVRAVFAAFPDYGCDAGAQQDAGWSHFTSVLFPAPYELQLMHTRQEVDRLVKQGDCGKERPVRHFVYFADWQTRTAFRGWAESRGFTCTEPPVVPGGAVPERPFQLVLSRSDPIDLVAMSALVAELFEAASERQGEYDGWETAVVPA